MICHYFARRVLHLAFTITFLVMQIEAQSEKPALYRPTVMIDIEKLSDGPRAIVLTSLVRLKPVQNWDTFAVLPGDTLSEIVYSNYGYSETKHPLTATALKNLIVEANQLADSSSLLSGQTIRIPLLPTRPFAKSAETNLVQLMDLQTNSVILSSTAKIYSSSKSITLNEDSLPKGDTWVVEMSPQENDRFLAGIPAELRNQMLDE